MGMIFMVETVAQLIFQLPGGILTDRLGRKKMIVLGSVFRAISPLIYLATGSWQFVLVGMLITQMSNMMVPIIARSLPRSMVWRALLDNVSPSSPSYLASASSAVAFLIFSILFKELKEKAD
jgi:MFS family permease